MKSDNKIPNVNRDYPENDISNQQHLNSQQKEQSSGDNTQLGKKPVYIKDMPEIKPASPDQGV